MTAIRLATASDADAIATIYRPYVEGTRISFEERAPDATEIARRMESPLHPWLVAEEDGRVLGYASSSPYHRRRAYRWTVETSIYVAADAQGHGIGRHLLSALIELLTRQGYVTAIAAIALPNPVSIALHQRLGFVAAGTYRGVGFKLDEWSDVSLWQRDLAPRTATPSEPRSPTMEIIGDPSERFDRLVDDLPVRGNDADEVRHCGPLTKLCGKRLPVLHEQPFHLAGHSGAVDAEAEETGHDVRAEALGMSNVGDDVVEDQRDARWSTHD